MFHVLLHHYIDTSKLPSLFRSHYYQLCKAVSSQYNVITPLADILYGSRLVTDETRLAVQNTLGLSPYDRATKLLNPAIQVAQESMELTKRFYEDLHKCEIPVPESILTGKFCLTR